MLYVLLLHKQAQTKKVRTDEAVPNEKITIHNMEDKIMRRNHSIRRAAAMTLAAALLTGALAGCAATQDSGNNAGNNGEEADSQNGAKESDMEGNDSEAAFYAEENTIRFALPAGNIRTAVQILASELGYYEEEGVNVEFVDISDTTAGLTTISSGKTDLDVWGTGIVPDLTFIANGSDLVIFEGTAAEGGAIIATEENVEKYQDLDNYEGITAAMVRNSSSWVITRAKLLERGIDVDSITLLEVDSQANVAQAVAKGEADLGFLPIEYANSFRDIGVSLVMEAGELSPLYVCCRQITSSTKLEEKHDAFVKFTKANLRALEYFEDEANRDEVVSILAEYSGQTEDYVYEYFFVNNTILTLDPNRSGIITFYESLVDSGYFEDGTDVDVDDHIDTSVYKEALDEIIAEYPDDAFFQEQLEIYNEYN